MPPTQAPYETDESINHCMKRGQENAILDVTPNPVWQVIIATVASGALWICRKWRLFAELLMT